MMNGKLFSKAIVTLLAACLFASAPLSGALAAASGDSGGDLQQTVKDKARDLGDGAEKVYKELTQGASETYKDTKQNVGGYLDDASITAMVKSKILGQKGLDSLDIKVETVNGVVTLSGVVNHQAQVSLAEEIARHSDGVKGVDNRLSVRN